MVILIISLFLAFIMWSILRLSQTYSTMFRYDVIIHTSMRGRASSAISTDPIIVRGKASGFAILQNKYYLDNSTVDIKVDPKLLKKVYGKEDLFFLTASDVKESIQQNIEMNLFVDNIAFDSLFFYIYSQAYKKVPVVAMQNITFEKQYMNNGGMTLKPDSIYVFGKTSIVESIDSVCTKEITRDRIKKNIDGIITLQPIENIDFSVSEIFFSLNVVRYFENRVVVPLNVLNPPAKYVLQIPADIELVFRAEYNSSNRYKSSNFKAYINYDDPISKGSGGVYAKVVVDEYPDGIIEIKANPPYVRIF